MHQLTRRLLPALAVAALIALPGRADHIPGHNDGDPIFPMPIPGQDTYSGGIIFISLIGPDAGSEIFGTTYQITYVSDGVTPASDIAMEVHIPTEDGTVTHYLTGADLGFGSGPGTFTGKFSTDALNGVVTGGFFPWATVDLTIGAVNGGAINGTGYFVDSFILLDVAGDQACPGDTDADGQVDVNDLVHVITDWGTDGTANGGDIDGSGLVDVDDVVAVITGWGACP